MCKKCGKPNHFAIVCRSRAAGVRINHVTERQAKATEQENVVEFDTVTMSSLSNRDHNWHEYVQVGDCIVHFKLDTGAMASVLPYSLFKKACPEAHLTATPTRLQAFINSTVKPQGVATILTKYQDCTRLVTYYVTDEVDAAILGQLGCNIFLLVQRIKQVLPDTLRRQ